MLQNLIVFVIVALAALYAAWRWMPAGWRRQLARLLALGSQRSGWVDAAQVNTISATLAQSSGCGSCNSCGSCATPSRSDPSVRSS